jgi:hypothetical protein
MRCQVVYLTLAWEVVLLRTHSIHLPQRQEDFSRCRGIEYSRAGLVDAAGKYMVKYPNLVSSG